MECYEYPDPGVFDEVTQGIKLTGQTPVTGIPCGVLDRIRPQGEEDATVHEKTSEERSKGWARGPVFCDALTGGCLVSRRFGLRQGEKLGWLMTLVLVRLTSWLRCRSQRKTTWSRCGGSCDTRIHESVAG